MDKYKKGTEIPPRKSKCARRKRLKPRYVVHFRLSHKRNTSLSLSLSLSQLCSYYECLLL
jgi:hypothetical protein